MKGVLDRFADNEWAVILIESINKEIHIPMHELPEGSKEQTWFDMQEMDGNYSIVSIDHEQTRNAKEKSKDIASQLQAKMKQSKYKR